MNNHIKDLNTLIEIKKWIDDFLSGQGYCIICGHDDPLDLESDHIGARANSDAIVSLCRNCHGRKSKIQRRTWPQGWYDKNTSFKKQALVIRGLSDILRLKSDHMMRSKND
jgi:hypothetical protein